MATATTQLMRTCSPSITFNAPHLNVSFNPNNPPPVPSPSFLSLRHQIDTLWSRTEAAELSLVALDDPVHTQVLNWISSSKGRPSQEQVWRERQRIILKLHEPAIAEAERLCQELERRVEELDEAAQREMETLEGKAAVKLDVPVMRSCLEVTREIVEAAMAQLRVARKVLGV